ncbi:MAG TPA: helicase-associated domain-containing protein [Kofleriaceae bacterium]|jgi:hypothetical protein|nr:helicase-associated domain-containing protein [Kofleriaceae bacterium]
MAISSTSWHQPSGGWLLDDIPDLALAGMLGIPADQVPARRAKLAEQQREPAWVEAALEKLPAATLSILQLLAEGGGIGTDLDLARAAKARYGLREDLYRHAVLPALRAALVVPLSTRAAGSALALVQPAAKLVAPQVVDLDITPLSLTAFVPEAPAGADARTFLALCIATRHFDLKLNKGGDLHFGAVKRLAKQVGVDERAADRMLRVALEAKLVAPDGELVRPDASALVATAAGHYPASTGMTALQALLASGPIERDAALRWCERSALLQVARVISDGLSYLPGFTIGTVDGEAALSYRTPAGSASGHITPSFEVILPPESRLVDVVQVGACCDWVRLDRALVARITRPAVSRALAAGATGDQVLGWLASASQHPIPQNVEVAIRDWARAVIPATLATGHVVVVDAAVEGQALAALGKLDPRRVAPGVLVVGSAVPARDVSKALLAAGIQLDPGAPARSRPTTPNPPAEPGLTAPRLRGKVMAWRRGEPFEGVRDSYLDNLQASAPTSGEAARRPALDPLARLVEWVGAHGIDDSAEVIDHLFDGPMGPVLAQLSARDIDQLFSGAQSLDDLIKNVAKLVAQRGIGRPPAISHPPRATGPSSGSPRAGRRRPVLLWQQEQLRPRLEAAAERTEWIALDVGGSVRFIEIEQVARRGSMWFVLGDDLEDGTAVALALDKITAIAALPDDVDLDDLLAQEPAAPSERGGASLPWRPPPGTPAPAGHVTCPCGSGERYRNCCRRAALA